MQQLKKPVQVPSCKMPPLTKYERIRKETALEALRDALRSTGRLIRPRPGNGGYDAVRVAMLHWHPDFDDLSEKERKALLRSATKWLKLRKKKHGPHASVDVERHASLRRELVELLEAPEAALTAEAVRSRQRRLSPNKADDGDQSSVAFCIVDGDGAVKEVVKKDKKRKGENDKKKEKKKKRRRDAGDDEADDEDDEPAAARPRVPGTARQASMRSARAEKEQARAAQAVSVSPDPPAAERPRDEESTGDERSVDPQTPFAEALRALPQPSANLEEAAQLLEKMRKGVLVDAFDELGDKPPALPSARGKHRLGSLRSGQVTVENFLSFSRSLAGTHLARVDRSRKREKVQHLLFGHRGKRGQFEHRTLALLLRIAERSRDAAVISARDRHRQNSYLPAIPGYAADVVLESLAAGVTPLELATFARELADWLELMGDVNREIEASALDLRELARLRVVQAVASAFYILVFFIPGRAVSRKYRVIDLRQGDVKLMFARLRSMSIGELAGLSTHASKHRTRKTPTPRKPPMPRKPPTPREPVEEVRGGQRLDEAALAALRERYAREQAASKPAAKKQRV